MLVTLDNQVHQAVLVQWVILVHQVLHFQVKEEKRVSQVLLVRVVVFFQTWYNIIYFSNRYSWSTRFTRCERRTRYVYDIIEQQFLYSCFVFRSTSTTRYHINARRTWRKRWSRSIRYSRFTRPSSMTYLERLFTDLSFDTFLGSEWFTRLTRITWT